MSSSRTVRQDEQQHPWTFSAYHTTVLTNFVSALQAEVRRQQDAYDHATEMLQAQADTGPSSSLLELGVPLHATQEEQIQVLRDRYALATLDTGALVALGPYRLVHTLKTHMSRIEDERRAGAVAAGNGTGGRLIHSDKTSHALKSETNVSTPPQRRYKSDQTSHYPAATPSPPRIKTERSEDDTAAQQQLLPCENSSPLSVSIPLTVATSALTQAKLEPSSNKAVSVPSSGNADVNGIGDNCPPSWMTFIKEAAKPSLSSAKDYNGAYFVPSASPPGAPLARYLSTSVFSRFPGNPAPLSSFSLPTLVVPVKPEKNMHRNSKERKRAAVLSVQAGKRCRSVTTSQTSAAAEDEAPLLSQAQHAKISRLQERVRFLDPTLPPSFPSDGKQSEDRLLDLWLRVWPGPSSRSVADAEGCSRKQRATATPQSARHACIRPTASIINALTRVAELNYKRDCERILAQREYLSTLPNPRYFLGESGAAAGAAVREKQPQATSEAPGASPSLREAPRHLQDKLLRTQAQLDAAYAQRMALFVELKEVLRCTAAVSGEGATGNAAAEARRALPTRMPRKPRRAASPSGGREKAQQSRCADPEAGEMIVVHGDGNGAEEAVLDTPTKNEMIRATALELLHTSLSNPALLMRHARNARESLVCAPADADPSVTALGSPSHVASEEAVDLPNGIVSINLPSLDDDRDAPELEEYLWPEDLDARIRHELRGFVSPKSHKSKANSVHVVLSAAQVQQLEAAVCVLSTVNPVSAHRAVIPPMVSEGMMAHPRFAELAWLYVHGRGESIVANVELN